jgi:hypothetical protein
MFIVALLSLIENNNRCKQEQASVFRLRAVHLSRDKFKRCSPTGVVLINCHLDRGVHILERDAPVIASSLLFGQVDPRDDRASRSTVG